MKRGKKLLEKLARAPRVIDMLVKIEWAQLASRGIGRYTQFRVKSLRNRLSNEYPHALQIEPFGGCNIRCKMCFQGRMELPADEVMMEMGLYRRIIDQMSPFTPMLYLYWRGEPLLHSDLGDMIRYAKKKGMYVFISTNAVTLTASKARELIQAKPDFLMIGFDGATHETYSQMRPGVHFEDICTNVRALARVKRQYRSLLPHVCLQFIVSQVNAHELPAAKQLAQELRADSFLEKSLDVYINFHEEKIDRALQPLFVDDEVSKYTQNDGLQFSGPSKCEMATRMVIRADGVLSICCYDMQGQYAIGSAKEEQLLDLWRSPRYVMLRRKGENRQLPLCLNCGAGVQK